ncbi:hypothetical protein DEO72_LG5g1556 [Vigna unguiculata]|uniref:Uncharacterized protein n=1 Tax=Vigna unguiculata TaxID=3917 RepID=A0A4D6LYQ3_VIGUN|nr:hypothetical protein DEO72_LG5g1556 [Vigna unguiculata]
MVFVLQTLFLHKRDPPLFFLNFIRHFCRVKPSPRFSLLKPSPLLCRMKCSPLESHSPPFCLIKP